MASARITPELASALSGLMSEPRAEAAAIVGFMREVVVVGQTEAA